MKELNVVLACNGGVSTKTLCRKIHEAGISLGVDVVCDAFPVAVVGDHLDGVDAMLIGPQIKWMESQLRNQYPTISIQVMDMRDYGTMNGQAILEKLMEQLG